MVRKFLENKDFLAGMMLLTVGGAAFWMALDYPFGSALRMGPGYFPRVLAGILMLFGVYVLTRGLMRPEPVRGVWGFKALFFVCLSLVVFGYLMEVVGLIPALVAMVFVSAYGGQEFRLKEVVIVAVFLTFLAWAIFIYGLGLPYPLVKGFGYGGY